MHVAGLWFAISLHANRMLCLIDTYWIVVLCIWYICTNFEYSYSSTCYLHGVYRMIVCKCTFVVHNLCCMLSSYSYIGMCLHVWCIFYWRLVMLYVLIFYSVSTSCLHLLCMHVYVRFSYVCYFNVVCMWHSCCLQVLCILYWCFRHVVCIKYMLSAYGVYASVCTFFERMLYVVCIWQACCLQFSAC